MTPPPELDSAFVAAALGDALQQRCGPERRFDRAVIDSRLVQPGCLFVALPGDHGDGHDFALDAAERGAAGLLLARRVEGLDRFDAARFYVDDALTALQRLAIAWRAAVPAVQVVGITGNVGKTTTKAITAAVLATRYRVQASEGSYNNEIGVPLSLLALRPETERAVIEMGMYTTGEIAELCRWARPRIGVVLNVGPVHLERAGSMEAIVAAKQELVEALPSDGLAILNADDEAVRGMASRTSARVWTIGSGDGVDVRGSDIVSHGAGGFDFTLSHRGASVRARVPLPGTHLVTNVLASAAVALADGMTLDEVASALERLEQTPRLRVKRLEGGLTLIDDTYNANPASMEAALALLEELPGRRLALLGDMRELGPLSEQSHDRIGRRAAEVVDMLYTIGELAGRMGEAARAAGMERTQHVDSYELAVDLLRATLRPGDALLVKGSRALALERVVEALEGAGGWTTR